MRTSKRWIEPSNDKQKKKKIKQSPSTTMTMTNIRWGDEIKDPTIVITVIFPAQTTFEIYMFKVVGGKQ